MVTYVKWLAAKKGCQQFIKNTNITQPRKLAVSTKQAGFELRQQNWYCNY
jgi:hypothetical protein